MTNTTDPRKPGGRYWSGYWREEYRVVAMDDQGRFLVQWATDGRQTRHQTPWRPDRDRVVSH